MSYELRFTIPFLGLAVVLFFGIFTYLLWKRSLRRRIYHSAGTSRGIARSAEHLFALMDKDHSGNLDAKELGIILEYLNPKLGYKRSTERARDIISTLDVRDTAMISKHAFVSAVVEGRLAKLSRSLAHREQSLHESAATAVTAADAAESGSGSGDNHCPTTSSWIYRIEADRIRSIHQSVVINIMLLFHAPISKRVFLFFNTHTLENRRFLRVDYSMEYGSPRWKAFLPYVLIVAIAYTAGLPLYILSRLCLNRKSLHSPRIESVYGFLYTRYVNGAEMWEVHEIMRKMVLCGLLVYLDPVTRAAVSAIICLLAVGSLNYFHAHRNKYVFTACNCAFVATGVKFLNVPVLMILDYKQNEASNLGAGDENQGQSTIAAMLIGVDIFVIFVSLMSAGAVVYNLLNLHKKVEARERLEAQRLKVKKEEKEKEGKLYPAETKKGKNKTEVRKTTEKKKINPSSVRVFPAEAQQGGGDVDVPGGATLPAGTGTSDRRTLLPAPELHLQNRAKAKSAAVPAAANAEAASAEAIGDVGDGARKRVRTKRSETVPKSIPPRPRKKGVQTKRSETAQVIVPKGVVPKGVAPKGVLPPKSIPPRPRKKGVQTKRSETAQVIVPKGVVPKGVLPKDALPKIVAP